jgi:hypothetical protein
MAAHSPSTGVSWFAHGTGESHGVRQLLNRAYADSGWMARAGSSEGASATNCGRHNFRYGTDPNRLVNRTDSSRAESVAESVSFSWPLTSALCFTRTVGASASEWCRQMLDSEVGTRGPRVRLGGRVRCPQRAAPTECLTPESVGPTLVVPWCALRDPRREEG